MTRIYSHKAFAATLGGLVALMLATGSGCSIIVKHVAGTAVKNMAKSGYEHFKETRDHNAKARESRTNDATDRHSQNDHPSTDAESESHP